MGLKGVQLVQLFGGCNSEDICTLIMSRKGKIVILCFVNIMRSGYGSVFNCS